MNKFLPLLALLLIFVSQAGLAAGGKNQNQTLNPVLNEDYNCVENLPAGVDLEECKELPSNPNSTTTVYSCPPFEGDIIVVCTEDD